MDDFLVIEKVTKRFGAVRAVDCITLRIACGESFSLLGPSGCGKTTLLRMIAGFERPDEGRILLEGEDITTLPPERRPVNTVFQNYALFPHLSVEENIGFGLKMAGVERGEARQRVARMLELVKMQDQRAKRPAQLSGGQKQRVAIARALVNQPRVLLLDEPLAALDLKLRQHMLGELHAIHQEVGTTFIYVTHDQGEAISLSDRIAVLNAGRVEQVDTPARLYEAPGSHFVAAFVGDANFLPARVLEVRHEGYVRVACEELGNPLACTALPLSAGQQARLMVRPEKLLITRERPEAGERVNVWAGTITDVTYFGAYLRFVVQAGETALLVQMANNRFASSGTVPGRGERVYVSFHPEEARVVAADSQG
ncbi:MAG: ABC transporter ATP-binding protein [Verrucomicrobiaceae bacterium]|jgi:spermidine/putrescine transport system ATP-binding protein|nr:ABC transporter ATP-binding protein [Verrucomicrobiaceae bacterium]